MKIDKDEIVEKEKKHLEALYKVFIEQYNKRDFYIDLANYLDFILKSPVFSKISKDLEKEVFLNLEDLEPSVIQEKARLLFKSRHPTTFESAKKSNIKIDVSKEYQEFLEKFESKRNKETWGSWERLYWVYAVVKEIEITSRTKILWHPNHRFKFQHFAFELRNIINYKTKDDEQRDPQLLNVIENARDDPNEIEFFRTYAKRIHTYLSTQARSLHNSKSKKSNENNLIEMIECVLTDESKFKVAVNQDYTNILIFDKKSINGEILYELAETGRAPYSKSAFDYINRNQNNRLYTQTGLNLTKILQQDGASIVADPQVKIEMLSSKALSTRSNKQAA